MSNLNDLFEEDENRKLEEFRAEQADPVLQAKIAEAVKAQIAESEARFDAEVAAGLRDENGDWIRSDPDEEEKEDLDDE